MGEFLIILQICGFLYIRDIWCSDLSWDKKIRVLFLGLLPTMMYISIYIKPLSEEDFKTSIDQHVMR